MAYQFFKGIVQNINSLLFWYGEKYMIAPDKQKQIICSPGAFKIMSSLPTDYRLTIYRTKPMLTVFLTKLNCQTL